MNRHSSPHSKPFQLAQLCTVFCLSAFLWAYSTSTTMARDIDVDAGRHNTELGKEENSEWYTDKVSQFVASIFDHRRDRHFKRNGCFWEIREIRVKDRHYPRRTFTRRIMTPITPCAR